MATPNITIAGGTRRAEVESREDPKMRTGFGATMVLLLASAACAPEATAPQAAAVTPKLAPVVQPDAWCPAWYHAIQGTTAPEDKNRDGIVCYDPMNSLTPPIDNTGEPRAADRPSLTIVVDSALRDSAGQR